ncbi:MAG: hypothetical protein B6U76_05600 [Desulfurococcales archaeon ex4484_217_2]|nr:MAG: hypothetical protein B6U76_05600 [Desulfurococcales archaeon ex4484_217_2]
MFMIPEEIPKELEEMVCEVYSTGPKRYVLTLSSYEKIREAAKTLFNNGFRISTITTLDRGFYFELLYHFVKKNIIASIKILVPKGENKVPSITPIIPGANWLEREVRDLFGIEFVEHPEPKRVVLPPDWKDKPPLRKPVAPELPETYANYLMSLATKAALASLSGLAKRRRKQMGLPEIVTPVHESKEVIEEVKKISKELKVDRKVPIGGE